MMPLIRTFEPSDLLSLICKGDPFALVRFGDGEWRSIFGDIRRNCDGQPFADVRPDLERVLLSRPSYLVGMQSLAMRIMGTQISSWISSNGLTDLEWVNADVFARMALQDRVHDFVKSFGDRHTILVGPPHLDNMKIFRPHAHVLVEPKGKAHEKRILVAAKTLSLVRDDSIVLVSAGMSAKGMIHDLHASCGDRAILMDVGSMWDPFAGVRSRTYHDTVISRFNP